MAERLSGPKPIGNRNTRIMGNLAISLLGSTAGIFDGLDYPKETETVIDHNGKTIPKKRFISPEEFFMWEHGWHTEKEYNESYRRLRAILGPKTYEMGGASVSKFQSWGMVEDMKYVFKGIIGALENLPQLNTYFNDIKDFIMYKPPIVKKGIINSSFYIRFHDDMDPHKDWISDPHINKIIKHIPPVWGGVPAEVIQPLLPYEFVKLCEEELEFRQLDLEPKVKGDLLTIVDPIEKKRVHFATRVGLIEDRNFHHEYLCGDPAFTGETFEIRSSKLTKYAGFKTIRPLSTKEITLIPEGSVLNSDDFTGSPYHLIKFSCRKASTIKSIYYPMVFKFTSKRAIKKSLPDLMDQIVQESKEKAARIHLQEEIIEARTAALKEEEKKRRHSETMAAITYLFIGTAHNLRNPLKAIEVLMNQQSNTSQKLILDQRFLNAWGIADEDQAGLTNFISTKYSGEIELQDVDTGVATKRGRKLRSKLSEIAPDLNMSLRHARSLAAYNIHTKDLSQLKPYMEKYSIDTLMEILDYAFKIKTPTYSAKKAFTTAYEIINSTMDVAEISERKDVETDLNLELEKIISDYQPTFKDQAITVTTDFNPDIPRINMDTRFISTIYHNLISNALYALRPYADPRDLVFRTTIEDGKVVAEVTDKGSGILEEDLPKIFLPFFTTKPEGEGKGIGLYSVHEIMNAYGAIEVSSKERETTFKLTIDDNPIDLNNN